MSLPLSILMFVASLAGVLGGSVLLSRGLRDVGKAIDIPEQALGFITALGADSPEISSSIVAMISGHPDVGAGVVFGSNLFNLASLLGLAAVIGGRMRVRKGTALVNGCVGLGVTAFAVLLVLRWIPAVIAVAFIIALPLPYTALLWMRRPRIEALPLPRSWASFLADATEESQEHGRQIQETENEGTKQPERDAKSTEHEVGKAKAFVKAGGALVLIITGSIGLVNMTTRLTSAWLPHDLLGPLVLAGLTGIPNVYTAVRLATRHKGAAVLTEAMNSNLLNIVVGLAVPALVFGGVGLAKSGALDAVWLLGLTIAATALTARRGGLTRIEGGALIAAYLTFVAFRVYSVLS